MLLNPCELNGKKFHWNQNFKTGMADASELGFKPGEVPGGQLYDDACDVGITLCNVHKTHWSYHGDIHRGDELQGWIFVPCPEDVRKWPHLQGWKVHILND